MLLVVLWYGPNTKKGDPRMEQVRRRAVVAGGAALTLIPTAGYAVNHDDGCTPPVPTPGDTSFDWDGFADNMQSCGNFWAATSLWLITAAGVLASVGEPVVSKFAAIDALAASGMAGLNSAYYYGISSWARTTKSDPFDAFVQFQPPVIPSTFDFDDPDLEEFSSSLFEHALAAAAFISAVRALQATKVDTPQFDAAIVALIAAEEQHLTWSSALNDTLDKGLKALDKQAKEEEFSNAIEACALAGKLTCADFFVTDVTPLAQTVFDDLGVAEFMDEMLASFSGEVLADYDGFAKSIDKELKDIDKDVKKLGFSLTDFVELFACAG